MTCIFFLLLCKWVCMVYCDRYYVWWWKNKIKYTCTTLFFVSLSAGDVFCWQPLQQFGHHRRPVGVLIRWASTRENLSSGEGVCEQQRRRPDSACARSDQRLHYSFIVQYHIQTCYKRNINFLGSRGSWAGLFEHDLGRDHWDRVFFYHDEAQIIKALQALHEETNLKWPGNTTDQPMTPRGNITFRIQQR